MTKREQANTLHNSMNLNSVEHEKRNRNILGRVVKYTGTVALAASFTVGSWLMFKDNNMDDFTDLRKFTSAEHQDDRCKIQAAFDAQVKMREHFEDQGGISEEQAELMAPIVGLETDEIKILTAEELFPMDYDCDVPVASSQEATTGLILVTSALAAGIGAGAVSLTRRRQ